MDRGLYLECQLGAGSYSPPPKKWVSPGHELNWTGFSNTFDTIISFLTIQPGCIFGEALDIIMKALEDWEGAAMYRKKNEGEMEKGTEKK